jgi:D-aminopeptidase
MMIVATDVPLRLLNRVAKRATLGMARVGSTGGHASGDYVIAFSTTYRARGGPEVLNDNESAIDVVFEAVADATEEAILNSMSRAHTVGGRDRNTRSALPLDVVLDRLRSPGRL